LGGEDPTNHWTKAGGEHPIKHVGPMKLSWNQSRHSFEANPAGRQTIHNVGGLAERDNVVYWKTNGKINNDLQVGWHVSSG